MTGLRRTLGGMWWRRSRLGLASSSRSRERSRPRPRPRSARGETWSRTQESRHTDYAAPPGKHTLISAVWRGAECSTLLHLLPSFLPSFLLLLPLFTFPPRYLQFTRVCSFTNSTHLSCRLYWIQFHVYHLTLTRHYY